MLRIPHCLDQRWITGGPRLDLLRPPSSLMFIKKNLNVSLAYSILQLTVYVLTGLDSSNSFLATVFMSWKLTTLLKGTLYLAPDGVL
jgi:hypothetical protein